MKPAIILFLESIGGGELMVVMLFVLLFFGSEKIPDLARGLGKGMRQFKDAMNGVQSEINQGMRQVEKQITEELPKAEIHPLAQPQSSIADAIKNEVLKDGVPTDVPLKSDKADKNETSL